MITKPMLAAKCGNPAALSFPVLATPKLDGIRCLKINGRAVSRTFKPISNRFIREWIEANCPDGVDGELTVPGTTFSETAGHVGRESGEPAFLFSVFDWVFEGNIAAPYKDRVHNLDGMIEFSGSDPRQPYVKAVMPVMIRNVAELDAYEEKCLGEGYEGVMVRTPGSPYKCGRSTEREGWLLKIKRFEDAEAVILDTYEGMSNQNEAEKDAFGRTKRSSAQAGKIGRGELGGFVVRSLDTGIEFRVGYNHVVGGIDRLTLWGQRESLIGKFVRFSHQPSGAKDAPRFPKFTGFREAWDMDS